MQNITINVPEPVAVWAKLWATQHNSSVSRLIGELLEKRMHEETAYHAAQQAYLTKAPTHLRSSDANYPTRESLYER